MSHPQSDSTGPLSAAQHKTLFVAESRSGPVMAVLYLRAKGKQSTKPMKFQTAQAALDWCIDHRAGMVFTLADSPADN